MRRPPRDLSEYLLRDSERITTMAAPHSVDPAAMLEQQLQGASADLLREMIATFANAMMSAQADQVCGADYGQRSAERVNQRNGYRAREWDTRVARVGRGVGGAAGRRSEHGDGGTGGLA